MKLSKRLEHLASMVSKNSKVADIGTDHALLPIKLVLEGTAQCAIAMDLRSGPLERAREHIKAYGLEEKIQTRLSDGMRELRENEADSIVIAGLGGELMIEILRAREDLFHKEFILSPHSEWKAVRKYLREQGLNIVDEDMVLDERNKYYIMLKVKGSAHRDGNDSRGNHGKTVDPDASGRYDCFGAILIQKKHPVLLSYLDREEKMYMRILNDLRKKNPGENLQLRIRAIRNYLEMIQTTRCEMAGNDGKIQTTRCNMAGNDQKIQTT